jgi:uncharacterized cupin superfamily protein
MSESDPTSGPGLRSKKARDIEAGDVLTREDNRSVRRKVHSSQVIAGGIVQVWKEDGSVFQLHVDDSVYVEFKP